MVSRGRIVGEVTVDTGAFLGVVVIGEVVHGGVNFRFMFGALGTPHRAPTHTHILSLSLSGGVIYVFYA